MRSRAELARVLGEPIETKPSVRSVGSRLVVFTQLMFKCGCKAERENTPGYTPADDERCFEVENIFFCAQHERALA